MLSNVAVMVKNKKNNYSIYNSQPYKFDETILSKISTFNKLSYSLRQALKILKRNTLYAYTDGSSFSNPRNGGMGIRYIYLNESEEEQIIDYEPFGYKSASNNQMELLACVEALNHSLQLDVKSAYNRIEIRTDSRYVVDYIYFAQCVWPNQKWLNKDGRPILNVDLWKSLSKAIKGVKRPVVFEWVKGHAKDEHNKAVDKIAKKSAKAFLKPALTVVTLRRKTTKEKTKIGSVTNSGQKLTIRIVTSEYLKAQDIFRYRYEVLSIHSEYFGKIDFACSRLILKDAHTYIVSFNKSIKNPRILKLIQEVEKKDHTIKATEIS
jgi:ribonuclease HI